MAVCPNCQQQVLPSDAFCPACGISIPAEEARDLVSPPSSQPPVVDNQATGANRRTTCGVGCAMVVLAICVGLWAIGAIGGRKKVTEADPLDAAVYTVVEEDFQDVARPRVVGRIVIASADAEKTGAALAMAARTFLEDNPRARVVAVFGYSEGDDTDDAYTRGVAEVSRDGKGWTGDGRHQVGALGGKTDDGRILVAVGDALFGDPIFMSFDR